MAAKRLDGEALLRLTRYHQCFINLLSPSVYFQEKCLNRVEQQNFGYEIYLVSQICAFSHHLSNSLLCCTAPVLNLVNKWETNYILEADSLYGAVSFTTSVFIYTVLLPLWPRTESLACIQHVQYSTDHGVADGLQHPWCIVATTRKHFLSWVSNVLTWAI